MSLENLFLLALPIVLVHTGALIWWGATITATVRNHDRQLLDHEERLREARL